jgi:hypothetical protein
MDLQTFILDDIKTKPLIWYEHVQRMADNRVPKKVLELMPPRRRKRRRLRIRWIKGIQDAMAQRVEWKRTGDGER